MNFRDLSNIVLRDDKQCFLWLQEQRLVPQNGLCEVCGEIMKTYIKGPNMVLFRCRKMGENRHATVLNVLAGTLFEGSRFGLRRIVILMYYFSINQTSYEVLKRECSENNKLASPNTISMWLQYCREICVLWVEQFQVTDGLLGGDGVVVEIDECKIGKRKYNRGRLVDGTWILGMIEILPEGSRRGGRYRIEICPENKRDAATLIPIILRHVKPGTTIVTDMWKSYFGLTSEGYEHFTVNHTKNFIDPITGANTQTIESSWRSLKRSFSTGIRTNSLAVHLYEYLYRREVRCLQVDPFQHFVQTVAECYSEHYYFGGDSM